MARDTLPISAQVLEHLRRLGVAVPHVADDVTTDEYFAFWRDVAAADARPDLGISIGLAVFGRSVASIAAVQAPTVADAIRTIGRYKRLVCPEEVTLEVEGGEGSVRFDWTLATGDVPALLVDAVFASHVALLATATRDTARPLRIELARRPRHANVLRGHFKCPIVFGAAHDRIVFATSTLRLPLVTANRAAYERLLPGLEAKLAARRSLIGTVRVAIARTISAGSQPSIASIAERLRTTARTLQRQLGIANTTFGEQLEDVRRVAARRLLQHTELPPVDIAFLLGFEEPNSFARAFRTWERTTPLRWRAARS
jgi:AraC-like DNA-binding protein